MKRTKSSYHIGGNIMACGDGGAYAPTSTYSADNSEPVVRPINLMPLGGPSLQGTSVHIGYEISYQGMKPQKVYFATGKDTDGNDWGLDTVIPPESRNGAKIMPYTTMEGILRELQV